MSQSVGDYLIGCLQQCGVRHIFGYPGDGINGVFGALIAAKVAQPDLPVIALVGDGAMQMNNMPSRSRSPNTGSTGPIIAGSSASSTTKTSTS